MSTISDKEKDIVLMRLEVASPDLRFSSGDSSVTVSRDEMIQHIENGDAIGLEYIKIELEFLRAMKDGSLMRLITEVA